MPDTDRKGTGTIMKKLICAVLILLTASALCCAASAEQTTTLLVYMCGTDLQSDACEDLAEMAEVEAGSAINMVVLAGGAEEWDLEDLAGNSRTLAVIRDGYFDSLEDWGHASMGSPDSLKEFLSYGMSEYPADRMIVVLWDHGAGSEGGVCFDETAGDDVLTLVEINDVLTELEREDPGFRIDIFGCDACMMATYEMAAMLSHHNIGYYVASEELEPGSGWYYTGWLEALADDPSIANADLCGAIVDTYMQEGMLQDPDDYLTLSAVDLSRMGTLERSMENFASLLSSEIRGGNLSAISRGRSRMYTFGSFCDSSWDMVDLGAVLDAYATFDSDNAAEARRALSAAVIFSSHTTNLDSCCGLSVLIPQDTAETFGDYSGNFDYSDIIPNWVEFVTSYAGMLTDGSCHISSSGTSAISADISFDDDSFYPFSYYPSGWMDWDDEEECYQEQTFSDQEIEIGDGYEGFTAQLSAEDLEYLDYVEGVLLMSVGEDGEEFYVEFGSMQNNLVDWNTGKVISLYDGSWPVFGGQPIPLYDQTKTDMTRRSLIPVKLNGAYTYLVVVFSGDSEEGRVIGANAGYDDNGLPIRSTTRLQPGDQIIPVYTTYFAAEGEEDLQEGTYEGDPITWQEGMTVTYEDLSDGEEETEMLFCFVFNDIFGEYDISDVISFTL